MEFSAIDHVEFNVGDAEQAADVLRTTFGFRVCGSAGPDTGNAAQLSLLLRQGDVVLLLTQGLGPEHPARQYVDRHGDGVASIALVRATNVLAIERNRTAAAAPR
jgi:4-hydroxymandelate synthase